jgi:glycosyltransferase involved in cell wall biosynthesis
LSPRRRLLFVSPCTPDRNGAGWEQRAYSFLLAYSRFMDVDLWFKPTSDNPDLARITSLSTLCRSITAFYPSVLDDERSGLKARLIGHLSSSDVVHVFRFQEFVRSISHSCIVWDIDELPWPLRHPDGNAGQRPLPSDQLERLRTTFAHCVSKCRAIIGCSRLERPTNCAEFTVVPNVVRCPSPAGAAAAVKDGSLLFVGNFNHVPNVDGLAFFKDQVLPLLDGILPKVQVVVVGRSPVTDGARSAVAQLQQGGRFRFAFDVPDCAPFYARSAASIAPIRFGGGTRVKIIESFAHRCPVVSTAKGCEGLDVEHGKQLLIADSPAEFAQACADLLRSPPLRQQIANTAYSFYEREHSQEIVNTLLVSTIGKLSHH